MHHRRWTWSDMPDQHGRVAVVTGANAGIGFATASALAKRGATVVLACRDVQKGKRAAVAIASGDVPPEPLPVVALDLASPGSVRTAAAEILSAFPRLDLLINNAGVMAIPFQLSGHGVELTFATNHLGHFGLTGRLVAALVGTPGSRIVTISSTAHKRAEARFENVSSAEQYEPGAAYDRSKLANLLFTFELERRLRAASAETIAVAAHPGNARTDLWRTSARIERALLDPRLRWVTRLLAQSAEAAALPTLRAAVDPDVRGGEYLGPDGPFGYTGSPVRVEPDRRAHDQAAQQRLWDLSTELTGVEYPLATPVEM